MRIFWGAHAKVERATEQLKSLNAEVQRFRENPNPFAFLVQRNKEAGHYVFRLHSNWEPGTERRWAVILGEIVHDLRSALDHLIWEGIDLSDGEPDREHSFPMREAEPKGGFGAWAIRTWTDKRGRKRHGKLYGLDKVAIEIVERCQPYQGGDGPELLGRLDGLWQLDKHRMLLPIVLPMVEPELKLVDCELVKRGDRMEDGAYVAEVWVRPVGANPQVDVQADAPFDIAFGERLLIDDLLDVAKVFLIALIEPFERAFPDEEDLEARENLARFQEVLSAASTEKG